MTEQTPTTEDVERSRFNVAGVHHIIGTECLCGVRRLHKNRDRTEHILDAFIKELDLATHDRAVKAAALREVADEVRQGTGLYRCRLCAREYDVLEGRIGKFNYCFPDDTTQQNCLGMILSSI